MRIAVLSIKQLAPSQLRVTLRSSVKRDGSGQWIEKPASWSSQNDYDVSSDVADADFQAFDARINNWSKSTGDGLRRLEADLFTLLETTPAGLVWAQLRRDSKASGVRLRSLLELDGGLTAWPWEALRDPGNGAVADYVFADVENPACRFVRRATADVSSPWPVRVLVVIGPDAQGKQIDSNVERRALSRLFSQSRHDIEALLLVQPNIADVAAELQKFKPHVFHFMGHGAARTDAREGHLLLGKNGNTQTWTTTQIAVHFRDVPLMCAVLNACSTAADPTLIEVANAFLGKTPAVVAMGADIAGQSAASFAVAFYKSLLDGKQIECAVNEARGALQQVNTNIAHWAVPRLFVSHAQVEEGGSLPPLIRRTPNHAEAGPGLFNDLSYFVDRQTERAALVQQVAQAPVVWLRGDPLVGKSVLAKWFFERMLYHPGEARFLDFRSDARSTLSSFVGVLRRIRDGANGSGAQNPDFQRFNVACNALFAGKVVPVNPPLQFEADAGRVYDPAVGTPGNWRETLGGCFVDGLLKWAMRGPVTLVLDKFHDCDRTTQGELLQFVLDPLTRASNANLRLVVSSRDLPELHAINGMKAFPVAYFPTNAAPDILRDFVELLIIDEPRLSRAKRALDMFVEMRTESIPIWTGQLFTDLLQTLRGLKLL